MFTLPQLSYDYAALEPFIDTETMKLHHDKHHQTYVDKLNEALSGHDDLLAMPVEELLKALPTLSNDIQSKVRNHGGGHYNHSLFWELMAAPANEKVPEFFAPLQEEFSAKALARFGSGWTWLIQDSGQLKVVDSANQDNPLMENPSVKIILGLDVWEHAYYLKYQNKRADYIKAWYNVVNWSEVEKRLATV